MCFWEWITQKYIKWRGDAIGREKTMSEFALEIGVPQSTLSRWMQKDGREPTDDKSIRALADYFGPEVFDILKIDSGAWGVAYLPVDLRRRLERAVREVSQALVERDLSDDDPESERIAREILEKHGLIYKSTTYKP